MNALANMGANMSAMLLGDFSLTETQSDNAEDAEIGTVEMGQSSVPVNPPVTNPTHDAPMQSAESAENVEGKGSVETPLTPEREGGSETAPPHLLK